MESLEHVAPKVQFVHVLGQRISYTYDPNFKSCFGGWKFSDYLLKVHPNNFDNKLVLVSMSLPRSVPKRSHWSALASHKPNSVVCQKSLIATLKLLLRLVQGERLNYSFLPLMLHEIHPPLAPIQGIQVSLCPPYLRSSSLSMRLLAEHESSKGLN